LGFAPLPHDSRSAIARCLGIPMPKERGSALPQRTDKLFSSTAGLLLKYSVPFVFEVAGTDGCFEYGASFIQTA